MRPSKLIEAEPNVRGRPNLHRNYFVLALFNLVAITDGAGRLGEGAAITALWPLHQNQTVSA